MTSARPGSWLGLRGAGLLSALTIAALSGCGVEPVGGDPIRLTTEALFPERWLADPGVEEYVVVRDSASERWLFSVTDGGRCDLGPNRVWSVVSRGLGEERAIRIVLISLDGTKVEVRGLDCQVEGTSVAIGAVSWPFVDDRTFVVLGKDDAGMVVRVDLFDGESSVVGHTDGPLRVLNASSGDFDNGAQWIRGDASPPSRPRFSVIDGGEVVLRELGGVELGRAGTDVVQVERVESGGDVLWFRNADGLWRWEPGVLDPALIVPGGCGLAGSSVLYVRSPCAVGELSILTPSTWELTSIASNVVDHSVNGSFLAFTTEVASERRSYLMLADQAPREVPEGALPLATSGDEWVLLDGASIVALGPSGQPTTIFTGLAAWPVYLADGRILLYHDSDGSTATLSVFDPITLALEELATGVPPWGYIVQRLYVSGRSILFVLRDSVDSVGVLDAMVWPEGPRVTVAEEVVFFWPALYAEPASLFYATSGADPALWVVPL